MHEETSMVKNIDSDKEIATFQLDFSAESVCLENYLTIFKARCTARCVHLILKNMYSLRIH